MPTMIRVATAADAAQVQAIYAPVVEETAISFEWDPPSVEEMAVRIATTTATLPWLVVEHDGEVLGYTYASTLRTRAAYRWSVETSVYIREDARGRGVGRALYTSLFAALRELRIANVYAGITLPNDASIRLHESFGFEPAGVHRRVGFKLGAWHDVGWWQLLLPVGEGAPGTPVSLASLEDTATLTAALDAGLGHLDR